MMPWNTKKYSRINWKNRPSTSTSLGATNLNHMDVFLNEVDNALIEFEANKLNISTANGMLKSLSINTSTGVIVATELNGKTYTWDLNLEKIPVSFSLSEDGMLTMTTEDGTEFEVNISDLIKEYVFEDSDTIGFSKTFETTEDDQKGTYHVTAIIKAGSITAEHLNPDYRSEIQNFSNVAQTAANESLQYSKDSKRWAVGDAEYEGSSEDNSKYYSIQAKADADRAVEAADRAQAVSSVEIATPMMPGIVKPDGTSMKVQEDGTLSADEEFILDQPVGFAENQLISNIESGESIKTVFGKLKKIIGSLLDGAASTLLGQNLSESRALVSDVNGKVGVSSITDTEIGYLSGLTKNAQTQFDELNGNINNLIKTERITVPATNSNFATITLQEKPKYIISAYCDGMTPTPVAMIGSPQDKNVRLTFLSEMKQDSRFRVIYV